METPQEGQLKEHMEKEEEVGGEREYKAAVPERPWVMDRRSPSSASWVAESTGLGVGSSVLLTPAMVSDEEAKVTFQS